MKNVMKQIFFYFLLTLGKGHPKQTLVWVKKSGHTTAALYCRVCCLAPGQELQVLEDFFISLVQSVLQFTAGVLDFFIT